MASVGSSPTAPSRVRTTGWWIAATGAALLVLGVLFVLPVGSLERSLWARGAGLVATAAFALAAWRLPAGVRWVWWCIWGFQLLTVAGDVVYDYQEHTLGEVPSPGVTDVIYLTSYLFAIAGLFALGRIMRSDRQQEAWIDTGIITGAAAALVGTFVIAPTLDQAGGPIGAATIVSIAYPVMDFFLLCALVRITLGRGGPNASLTLLTGALVLFLVADYVYYLLMLTDAQSDPPIMEVLWLGALICLTFAVMAPGADRLEIQRVRAMGWISPWRLTAIGVGVLTAPVLLAGLLLGRSGLAFGLSVVSVLVVVLLLWRTNLLVRTVQGQSARLFELASADGLTGLPNRRSWDAEVVQAARYAREAGQPLTVGMLDLDHFKLFNDTHGHQAGDDALVASARAWRSQLSRRDVLARYGGEEFGLLLPGVALADAGAFLERLRRATPGVLTVSIGATEWVPGEDPTEAVSRADTALYRAKAAGRDCVKYEPQPAGQVTIPTEPGH